MSTVFLVRILATAVGGFYALVFTSSEAPLTTRSESKPYLWRGRARAANLQLSAARADFELAPRSARSGGALRLVSDFPIDTPQARDEGLVAIALYRCGPTAGARRGPASCVGCL